MQYCKKFLCRTNSLRLFVPHRHIPAVASSHRADPKEVDEENEKKVTRRTLRLEARVTKQEYTQAAELAKTCGLSMSDYVRRTALGQHPRQRLSEREVEALCSLTDARGDLIRIAAAVKSIQADKRAMYFSDTRFVEQWMRAATQLINRWSQIENYLTE